MKVKIYVKCSHFNTCIPKNTNEYYALSQYKPKYLKKTNYTTIVVKQSNLSVAKKEREKATFKYLQ